MHLHKQAGITSTYVENTTVQQDTTAVCQDHLHIRGEYDTDTDKERVYLGSPHIRGEYEKTTHFHTG